TSALDPAAIKAVEDAVNEFHQSGTRIVMTTHDLHQAKRLADDVLFMYGGQVLEHTPRRAFFFFFFFDAPTLFPRPRGGHPGASWFGEPHPALNKTQRSRP
ncbi:hypothetical protein DK37_30530, partial [Halomonas sp. SUBG004]